jgi:hypothetical protein
MREHLPQKELSSFEATTMFEEFSREMYWSLLPDMHPAEAQSAINRVAPEGAVKLQVKKFFFALLVLFAK